MNTFLGYWMKFKKKAKKINIKLINFKNLLIIFQFNLNIFLIGDIMGIETHPNQVLLFNDDYELSEADIFRRPVCTMALFLQKIFPFPHSTTAR